MSLKRVSDKGISNGDWFIMGPRSLSIIEIKEVLNARSPGDLAVKRGHGVPIAKFNLIKNRGQIMPPIYFNIRKFQRIYRLNIVDQFYLYLFHLYQNI